MFLFLNPMFLVLPGATRTAARPAVLSSVAIRIVLAGRVSGACLLVGMSDDQHEAAGGIAVWLAADQ